MKIVMAWELVQIWLQARFRGAETPRYGRREAKLQEIEELFMRPDWK